MHPALTRILEKLALPGILERLAQLKPSELSSLLLEVYRQQTSRLRPADLLARLPQNRFVQPAGLDPIALREAELAALQLARNTGFELVELSPVAPLGASSVYGRIDQNNVLSALRNCELIADPSNLMCLLMAQQMQRNPEQALHWFCSQRTLRTAFFEGPGRFAHFQMLAAVSLLYSREDEPLIAATLQHLSLQREIFSHFGLQQLHFKLWCKTQRSQLAEALQRALQASQQLQVQIMPEPGTDYYQGFQLKTFAWVEGTEWELADCGVVSWAAELKGDKGFQTLISGIGLERLLRL